jgi:hypothetical protein
MRNLRPALLFSVSTLLGCHSSQHAVGDAAAPADLSAEVHDLATSEDAGLDAGNLSIDLGTINHCDPAVDCPDLVLDSALLSASVVIESREFADPTQFPQNMPHTGSDCSVAEGSVGAAGVRRLLRFSTGATNDGLGDLLLGSPTDPQNAGFFVYAPCHGHYHFSGFANYKLLAQDGTVALNGHKQAFCIEDNVDKTGVEPNPMPPTNCESPGLHRGWSDVYTNHTEANWIDITGLAAGTYTLVVTLNDEHIIVESDYTNNAAQVQITIQDDPTPEICPSDTEALLRCVGESDPGTFATPMTRCYSGVRNTETCTSPGECTQPSEIAHQSHCGDGSSTSVSTTCPSNVSTTPYCTTATDPMTGATKSVRMWCANGVVNTEYCGVMCTTGTSGAVCQ